MQERQKQILDVFKVILPKMSAESQNYLLGYGEGMAAAMKHDDKNQQTQFMAQAEGR